MFKNVGAQWIRTVIFIVVGLLVPPLINRLLGTETYGAWDLVMSTTGIMKLLALGVPIATVRAIAAAKNSAEVNQVIGTSKKIFVFIGLLTLLVGGMLFAFFEMTYIRGSDPTINVEDAWQARIAFGLIVGHVALSFVMQLPYAILAGKQEFVTQNKIMIFILLVRVALIISVLFLGGSLIFLAIIELVALLMEFVFPWRAVKKKYPEYRCAIESFDRDTMKTIFGFGGFMVLMHVGMKLVFQTDSLVIGWGIGLAEVNYYARSNTFVVYLIELMIGVGGVIMPTATRLQKEGKLGELEDTFLRWSKITMSLALLVGIYLLVLGPEFVAWWMGQDKFYDPAKEVIPALMLSSFIFLPIRAVTLPMLLGLGLVKVPALLFLGTGIINVGLSMALVGDYGLFGVALGTAIPNTIYALIVLIYACRKNEFSVKKYASYVVPRCFLGALPVVAGLYWIREEFAPRSLVELILSGMVMVAMFAVIWVGFVYRGDQYTDLSGRLRSLLKRDPR